MFRLSKLLRSASCSIEALDLTCNDLNDKDISNLRDAVEENSTLISMDLRSNRVEETTNDDMLAIDAMTRRNELSRRGGPGFAKV